MINCPNGCEDCPYCQCDEKEEDPNWQLCNERFENDYLDCVSACDKTDFTCLSECNRLFEESMTNCPCEVELTCKLTNTNFFNRPVAQVDAHAATMSAIHPKRQHQLGLQQHQQLQPRTFSYWTQGVRSKLLRLTRSGRYTTILSSVLDPKQKSGKVVRS